jgi:hypothetical protein
MKIKIIYIINKFYGKIKIFFLILKFFNIEDLFNNLFNEIILNNIGEENTSTDKENTSTDKVVKEKSDYNNEIHKNSLMLKFIGSVALIC